MDIMRETHVTHLTAIGSDHCPILIEFDRKVEKGQNNFVFQGAWTKHHDFINFTGQNWDKEDTVWHNKNLFASKLKEWNRAVFGNIHLRKDNLLRRLDGIQRKMDHGGHRGLVQLERKIRKELEEVLQQEEILWFQQSREDWIASGDRNTKLYHAATKNKKAKTWRHNFLDSDGNPMNDEHMIERAIQEYFSGIFTKDVEADTSCIPKGKFPVLSEDSWSTFNAAFSIEEVKSALFDMRPLKAPGPDGFHAVFYQKAWQVVGRSVFLQVNQFMNSGKLDEGMNDTLIALIPKTGCPTNASQYRPISLCNVIYKIITKAMTNRIKPILRALVGQEQSSFVPGRQITDNILIYQEVVHSMRNKQGKKGLMILKIDLEKAYDRLNWEFIRDTLKDVGMNKEWVRNIMACVETPRLKVLWSGKQLEQITPSRGIRQGDAISPYLFVLCMERLSHVIKEEAGKGAWKGIQLSRYGPVLTHLFFADDLVLFAEASQEQISNVVREEAQLITSIAGIPESPNLGKYLGVPTLHGRVTNNLFTPLLEKMDDKLSGWKTKFLTLAGRQVKVLKEKYAHGKDGIEALYPKQLCSNAWRGIVAAGPFIRKGTRKFVKDGKATRFWEDPWVHEEPLLAFVQNYENPGKPLLAFVQNYENPGSMVLAFVQNYENPGSMVVEYWEDNRGWKWEKLPPLPEDIKPKMETIMVHNGDDADETFWNPEASGKFSISSAYFLIKGYQTNLQDHIWKKIWNLEVPNKLKTFLWIAMHDRVMGNAERKRRGLTLEGCCDLCPGHLESADHILRSCSRAKEIWLAYASREQRSKWRHLDFRRWIINNVTEHVAGEGTGEWSRRFAIIVWWLWRWRCDRVFNERDADVQHKIIWIRTAKEETERAFIRHKDVIVKVGCNRAGFAGVVRNNKGEWHGGIMSKSDYSDPSMVEVEAIVECLSWAWQRGLRDLEVQSDAKNVVQWFQNDSVGRGPIRQYIDKVKWWINRDWRISFRLVYREQNRVADCLASLGALQGSERNELDVCPIGSEEAYQDD
ncbi:uncharacterized protein LOC116020256 [Ipomoea triloba]|uniref:uncharacterized protein LOC116020256 n=1 Tax=Ipomoea triloba TaxID=35885 RepID=UPI00125D0927|nr:uncharacterized protein LOC116020256 [Ipomoea triloba]